MTLKLRSALLSLLIILTQSVSAQEVTLDREIPLTNNPNFSLNSTVAATSAFDVFFTLEVALQPSSPEEFQFSLAKHTAGSAENVSSRCRTAGSIAHHIEINEDGTTLLLLTRGIRPNSDLASAWVVDTTSNEGFCPPATANQPQRGWIKLMETQAVGGLSGAFSRNGNWLIIGAPGALEDGSNASSGAQITRGLISIFEKRRTGWSQIYDTSVIADIAEQENITPLNGETGAAVAVSDDGATVAITHPARRPSVLENPPTDVPGGPVPLDSGVSFPPGIFIGNFTSADGLSWQFLEVPSLIGNDPEVSAYPFQGIAEMNTNLRISPDGQRIYYLKNQFGGSGGNTVRLYTFERADGAWSITGDQPLLVSDAIDANQCLTGSAPLWFSEGQPIATDLILSEDQRRLAVVMVPENGLGTEASGVLCLFEAAAQNWQAVSVLGDRAAAALASSSLSAQSNRTATDGIMRLAASSDLSKMLLPSYNGAHILTIGWEEDIPAGLPIWLLYEASK